MTPARQKAQNSGGRRPAASALKQAELIDDVKHTLHLLDTVNNLKRYSVCHECEFELADIAPPALIEIKPPLQGPETELEAKFGREPVAPDSRGIRVIAPSSDAIDTIVDYLIASRKLVEIREREGSTYLFSRDFEERGSIVALEFSVEDPNYEPQPLPVRRELNEILESL